MRFLSPLHGSKRLHQFSKRWPTLERFGHSREFMPWTNSLSTTRACGEMRALTRGWESFARWWLRVRRRRRVGRAGRPTRRGRGPRNCLRDRARGGPAARGDGPLGEGDGEDEGAVGAEGDGAAGVGVRPRPGADEAAASVDQAIDALQRLARAAAGGVTVDDPRAVAVDQEDPMGGSQDHGCSSMTSGCAR